jgi:tRNA threonylcarbamoyl adenosine modification protein (Sua5/YciO/YrdC/YwlC family)
MQVFTSLSDAELLKFLQNGAVGVMPTDTLYGVVCRAADPHAVARLYELKSRERKPGTVIAATIEQLVELGVKARYLKAVEQFWPGAVSVQLPLDNSLSYYHQGVFHGAFRIPDNAEICALLEQTGPLLTSSANQPGGPPATNIAEARAYFGDQVDFYVDGGDLSGRGPSTVLRVVDDAIEILREGTVKIDEDGRVIK